MGDVISPPPNAACSVRLLIGFIAVPGFACRPQLRRRVPHLPVPQLPALPRLPLPLPLQGEHESVA